jgi:hypothetical protein
MFSRLLYPITYTHHMQESMVSEKKKIEDRLSKKLAEIGTLEEKLRAAKVYAAALRDVLKMLGGDDEADESVETKLRPGSAVAQTREIILGRGEPVHLDDILEAMGKEANRDTKASLAGSLAAYVRRNDIFTRPAPNTFGLVELGHVTVDDDQHAEPPAGFGIEPADPDIEEDVPF